MKAEEYINQIPIWTKEKNSLEHIRLFLDYLGNPDRQIPVIHVAGTNGKGSVCAFLTYALRRAGYHTGTFVSPHLVELRERFLLDGKMADPVCLERCFCQVKEAADVLMERGLHHPSFFEFLFYMAALLFSREKVDFWIVETGLGGRLDTTNAIEHPLVSVITSISLDHTKYLGNTIREIAGEKAGIIKEGVPVVYDANGGEAAAVIRARAEKLHARGIPVCRGDFNVYRGEAGLPGKKSGTGQDGSRGKSAGPAQAGGSGKDGPGSGNIVLEFKQKGRPVALPFKAGYQADNGALAWKTLELLMEEGRIGKEREELLRRGMEETRWPGRMEEVLPGVFLDGAHNPGGMEAFIQAAKDMAKGRKGKIFVLFAAAADKDYRNMVQYLWKGLKPDLAAAACLGSERSLSFRELTEVFGQEMGCRQVCFEKVKDAFNFLLGEKGSQDYLFCTGSLYLIGEIKAELERSGMS